MERDCIISHGISNFLRERLFLVSDLFRIHVCSNCGLMAVGNNEKNEYQCTLCKKVIYLIILEKKRPKNLSSSHSICSQTASSITYGDACGTKVNFRC